MKELHFSKKYFNKLVFDEDNIRVVVKEIPSIDILEEEYSLRVSTRFEDVSTIHRDYAIEHHPVSKHPFPHLQFKFNTEEIGQFRIRIDVMDSNEYKKAILGFIYKIKGVLEHLEKFKEGITSQILVLDLVNDLKNEGKFLGQKINEGIKKYYLEFDHKERIDKLKKNPLLIDFLGKENIKLIESQANLRS